MSTAVASRKKATGHRNERAFAALIGGDVGQLPHTGKTDVRDPGGATYSVKGGTWWQIFLYRRSRFKTNTVFRGRGIGRVPELMVACIDAFPDEYSEYRADRDAAKIRLQPSLRLLRAELAKPRILAAFFDKVLFNAGEVDYFVILPKDLTNARNSQKKFHVFAKSDVVQALCDVLGITNSQARRSDQFDDQKVLFRYKGKNCGEFELRNDSPSHYREAKFRLNGPTILHILKSHIKPRQSVTGQIIAYGTAVKKFRTNGKR